MDWGRALSPKFRSNGRIGRRRGAFRRGGWLYPPQLIARLDWVRISVGADVPRGGETWGVYLTRRGRCCGALSLGDSAGRLVSPWGFPINATASAS